MEEGKRLQVGQAGEVTCEAKTGGGELLSIGMT